MNSPFTATSLGWPSHQKVSRPRPQARLPLIYCEEDAVTANPASAKVTALRPEGEALGAAVACFLAERDLAPSSHRVYALALDRLVAHLGPDKPLAQVSPRVLARFMATRYSHLAPASWNRVAATLGSFFAYTTRQGWNATSPAAGLERRHPRTDREAHARTRAIPRA